MELFQENNQKLEKLESIAVTEEELSKISGGYSVVSDPIYSLTSKEATALKQAGYKLKKTNSGNYRITDENNKMASPSEIAVLCKVINRSPNNKGRTFWDWLSEI